MTYFIPAQAFHPGEYLHDELKERSMTQTVFAKILGKPLKTVNEIIHGKKSITPEFALLLESALSISAETWINLQKTYDLHKTKHKTTKKYSEVQKRAQQYFTEHNHTLSHA